MKKKQSDNAKNPFFPQEIIIKKNKNFPVLITIPVILVVVVLLYVIFK